MHKLLPGNIDTMSPAESLRQIISMSLTTCAICYPNTAVGLGLYWLFVAHSTPGERLTGAVGLAIALLIDAYLLYRYVPKLLHIVRQIRQNN